MFLRALPSLLPAHCDTHRLSLNWPRDPGCRSLECRLNHLQAATLLSGRLQCLGQTHLHPPLQQVVVQEGAALTGEDEGSSPRVGESGQALTNPGLDWYLNVQPL